MLCIAVVPLILDTDAAAVLMIYVTAGFGLVVLCRLVFEGLRDARSKKHRNTLSR
jgi:hypothetical protein